MLFVLIVEEKNENLGILVVNHTIIPEIPTGFVGTVGIELVCPYLSSLGVHENY